jgi:hypothetical protein
VTSLGTDAKKKRKHGLAALALITTPLALLFLGGKKDK